MFITVNNRFSRGEVAVFGQDVSGLEDSKRLRITPPCILCVITISLSLPLRSFSFNFELYIVR
jgi:hypothetical protein